MISIEYLKRKFGKKKRFYFYNDDENVFRLENQSFVWLNNENRISVDLFSIKINQKKWISEVIFLVLR